MINPFSTSIEVASGKLLDLANPSADTIELEDIAQALSQTARFGGHLKRFYSVAEHSIFVAQLVKARQGTPEQVLAALFHDAHEAYLGDLPTPLKTLIRDDSDVIDRAARALDLAIATKFGFGFDSLNDSLIHDADLAALWHEASVLLPSGGEHLGFTPPREWQHIPEGVAVPSDEEPFSPEVVAKAWEGFVTELLPTPVR